MLAPHDDVDNESSSDSFGEETQTAYQVVDMRPRLETEHLKHHPGEHAVDDSHRGGSSSSNMNDNPYSSNKEKEHMVSSRQSSESMNKEQHQRASLSSNRTQQEVESPTRSRSSITCTIS